MLLASFQRMLLTDCSVGGPLGGANAAGGGMLPPAVAVMGRAVVAVPGSAWSMCDSTQVHWQLAWAVGM
jgi:hypothetical protein